MHVCMLSIFDSSARLSQNNADERLQAISSECDKFAAQLMKYSDAMKDKANAQKTAHQTIVTKDKGVCLVARVHARA